MKIRTGFVTNSSSSSFIVLKFKSNKLNEIYTILSICETIVDEYGDLSMRDGCLIYTEEEGIYDYEATSEIEALNILLGLLTYGADDLYISENEDENESLNLDKYENQLAPSTWRLAASIFRNRKEILSDVESIDFNYSEYSWGGDGGERYYPDNYDSDTLAGIYKDIAESLGKPVNEVTEDDFYDYASDKNGVTKYSYNFTRSGDKVESDYFRSYTLED